MLGSLSPRYRPASPGPSLGTPLSLMRGACWTASPTALSARRRSRGAGPAPGCSRRGREGRATGATTAQGPPAARPPSSRSAPNGRSALGPSASPHIAPPRAALPLAAAEPWGPRLAPRRPWPRRSPERVRGERPGVTPDVVTSWGSQAEVGGRGGAGAGQVP